MTTARVQNQPAYLLHYRGFRETSLLLDVFSRDFGKLALVARGARAAKSRLRGVLRPFLPLRISWVARSDLGTCTGAELDGSPLALSGDNLLSGYYINELILNLLHRHDPQPEVFEVYAAAIAGLSGRNDPVPVLRRFELELLGLLGYGVNLDHDAQSGAPLKEDGNYAFDADLGPVEEERPEGAGIYRGQDLIGIREHRFEVAEVRQAANRLLKRIISHRLEGRELKSRKVLLDLHRGRDKILDRKTETGT